MNRALVDAESFPFASIEEVEDAITTILNEPDTDENEDLVQGFREYIPTRLRP